MTNIGWFLTENYLAIKRAFVVNGKYMGTFEGVDTRDLELCFMCYGEFDEQSGVYCPYVCPCEKQFTIFDTYEELFSEEVVKLEPRLE